MKDYIFRPPKITDFLSLVNLIMGVYANSYNIIIFLIFFWIIPLNLIISPLFSEYIVCEHLPTKKAVGTISTNKSLFKKKAEVVNFGVDKKHRRKHIGKQLMKKAISKLREDGYNDIIAKIRYDNVPVRNLLKSLGFKLKKGHVVYELLELP